MTKPVLKVDELVVHIADQPVVDGVSFQVNEGEILSVVGESGCGKSLTAFSVMGLLPKVAKIASGSIRFGESDLVSISDKARRGLRGNDLAMIFQEPVASLNPLMKIGRQIEESLVVHRNLSGKAARHAAIAMLEEVGIPEPEIRFGQYPFELSGGMCQRAMIAMALICRPRLLITDEPTTALDVTVQAQSLTLLREIREEGAGVMLITHDMGVVAQACTHVAVMYSGLVVENGPVRDVLDRPLHPYTQALLAAIPPLDGPRPERLPTIPGQPPTPDHRPTGCVFAPRCSFVRSECAVRPPLTEIEEGRRVACVLYAA